MDFFFIDEVELFPSPVNPETESEILSDREESVSNIFFGEFFNLVRYDARSTPVTQTGVQASFFTMRAHEPSPTPSQCGSTLVEFKRISVETRSGRRPIVPVINGIDAAHRFLASLFFDYMRDKSGRACDHENPVERGGVHSQIGENRADRAVHIDRERFLRVGECFLNRARRLHMHAVHAGFAREFEQTRSARIFRVQR